MQFISAFLVYAQYGVLNGVLGMRACAREYACMCGVMSLLIDMQAPLLVRRP